MATRDQEHERYLATDRERHPSSGIDFRPEAAAYRGPSRHVIHRYACPDGYQGVWPGSGDDRESRKGDREGIERGTLRYPLFRILRPCGRRPLSGDRTEP